MQGADAKSIRDSLIVSPIRFNEKDHTYTLGDRTYKGITSTLIPFAYPHTYDLPKGMTEEQWQEVLDKAAQKGTAVHRDIQAYLSDGDFPTTPEGLSWMEMESQHKVEWIANEYLVTSQRFASQIDIVALVDGELSIIDIKRTSELHYDTVTLQTSLYRKWFERMNPGLKVTRLYVFWAREDKWKLAELCPIADRSLADLVSAYNRHTAGYVFRPLPEWCRKNEMKRLAALVTQKRAIEEQIAEIQKAVEENMARYDTPTVDAGSGISITYIQPSVAKTFDKNRFEKEHPGMLAGYMKESMRKGFVKITHKQENKDKT